jgi:hypothetical protein
MIRRLLLAVLLGAHIAGCAAGQVATPPAAAAAPPAAAPGARPAAPARIDFDTEVRPILEAGCRPCHFEFGQMYDRLPFDRPETIRGLGTQLFTRIRKDEERSVIRAFLEQP